MLKKSSFTTLIFEKCLGLWQYRLYSFQVGGTKLEIFLPKKIKILKENY